MIKKRLALTAFLLVFGILSAGIAYASSATSSNIFSDSDISIDNVKVNGVAFAEDRTNFIQDTDNIDVVVSLTPLRDMSNIHVQAILTDLNTGNTISDSTNPFTIRTNQTTLVALNMRLIDVLKRQKNFRLDIEVVGVDGNSKTQSYGLRFTGGTVTSTGASGNFDLSVDRVRINSHIIATSTTNFIDRSSQYDVLVDITALQDLENTHVEAILKDLRSGNVVADASPNFNLQNNNATSTLLHLQLPSIFRQSNSFELTVKVIDAEGHLLQKVYGLKTRDTGGISGAGLPGGRALDVSVDSVEVESKVVAEDSDTFVIIPHDKTELQVKARITSLEDIASAHIEAILAFENGNVVADSTTPFDIAKDQNLIKLLKLPLASPFGQNRFNLKIRIIDAEGNTVEKSYGLIINEQKSPFVISSMSLSPEDSVDAGKNLEVALSIRNAGVVSLDRVTAKVSIPELGISSTKFVSSISASSDNAKADFVLKIPDTVETGTYTLRSEITSQFGGDSEVKEIPIYIAGKNDQANQLVNDKIVITVPVVKQTMRNDGNEVIYPIILRNDGPDAKTYSLLLDGSNWANLRLNEPNTFVVNPQETKTLSIYASSKANIKGEQIFVATVKSSGKVLKQIPLRGDIAASNTVSSNNLGSIMALTLISFVISLILIGLFVSIRWFIQDGKSSDVSSEIPDKDNGESYY